MSGHLGAANRTIQNLEVVRVDAERQLLLIKGAVPGPKGGDVVVRPAVKGGAGWISSSASKRFAGRNNFV